MQVYLPNRGSRKLSNTTNPKGKTEGDVWKEEKKRLRWLLLRRRQTYRGPSLSLPNQPVPTAFSSSAIHSKAFKAIPGKRPSMSFSPPSSSFLRACVRNPRRRRRRKKKKNASSLSLLWHIGPPPRSLLSTFFLSCPQASFHQIASFPRLLDLKIPLLPLEMC